MNIKDITVSIITPPIFTQAQKGLEANVRILTNTIHSIERNLNNDQEPAQVGLINITTQVSKDSLKTLRWKRLKLYASTGLLWTMIIVSLVWQILVYSLGFIVLLGSAVDAWPKVSQTLTGLFNMVGLYIY